jgi:hypothetical protein
MSADLDVTSCGMDDDVVAAASKVLEINAGVLLEL